MKAKVLGFLSAMIASICCLGPVVLVLVGFGGLGLGAILGKYHWYFILGAAALLAFAWRGYFKERKACASAHCEMGGRKMTKNILISASVVVLALAGLNFFTYAKGNLKEGLSKSGVQVSIPVKGMSCFTCEIAIQQAVKKLPGVSSVQASAREGTAQVSYDSQKTSLDEIVNAVNGTGYKAEKPKL
ncbi:MAG: heavy-metal-associated domain-containing protein [Chlamydiae bacterium]|nr:heavy-metal-associated domain-containing protein [Chlamydiota bacterium]MBI3267132.1 heavy-metal-associated domain-containing protein [Chlamydiota bacterium]